jgi:hypothetical protein
LRIDLPIWSIDHVAKPQERWSDIMCTVKKLLGSAVAILLIGGVVASSAQAVEGPYWKVAGSRLENTQTQPFRGSGPFSWLLRLSTVSVSCSKFALAGEPKLHGSTGANRGFSDEKLSFKGCTVSGSECKLTGEEFTTSELLGELVWPGAKREGKLLFHFEATSGKDFATLEFSNCNPAEIREGETTFDGLVCEAWSGKKAIEEGSEPAAGTVVELNCPEKALSESDLEVGGKLTSKPGELDFGTSVATLSGRASLELEGGKTWCVSTGAATSKC